MTVIARDAFKRIMFILAALFCVDFLAAVQRWFPTDYSNPWKLLTVEFLRATLTILGIYVLTFCWVRAHSSAYRQKR